MSDFNAEAQRRRGWEVRRSKYIWREVINLSKDGLEQLLSVSQYDGVRPASEASRSESLKGYKIVEKGDLVINIMLAWMGGLGVSEYDGIVSPAYAVYKLIAPMEPRFLHYLYRTRRYLADFARHLTGVVPSRWRMYSDDFGQVVTEFPPLPEQKAIVAYLDAETGRIDKAIAAEEKMIALLQERREIVINEAVGGGDLSHAEARCARREAVGLPEHEARTPKGPQGAARGRGWMIGRLKNITVKIGSGKTPKGGADVYSETGVPFIRSQNVYNEGLRLDDVSFISSRIDEEMKGTRVYCGDVLLNITGGSIGRCCLYEQEEHANVNQHVCIIRVAKGKSDPRYVKYFINGHAADIVGVNQTGGNREGLNFQNIGNISIPLPPLSEQEAIVERLDRETGKIGRAIEVKRRQIELLRERRQIVIDEVVTGKVKVA